MNHFPCCSLKIDRHHLLLCLLAVLTSVSIFQQGVFADEADTVTSDTSISAFWRKTTMGWETGKPRPHTRQKTECIKECDKECNKGCPTIELDFDHAEPPIPTPTLIERIHRCALPSAVAALLACVCPLCLIALPTSASAKL